MTYCVAMLPDTGMVFLSESRTRAGVDQISTFPQDHLDLRWSEALREVLAQLPELQWRAVEESRYECGCFAL